VLLAEGLSLAEVARFRVARLEHPGVRDRGHPAPLLPLGAHAAHVLGYLGEARAEELAAPGLPTAWATGSGAAASSAPTMRRLRGEAGERVVVVDSRGVPVEEFGRRGSAGRASACG
jgi:cell division protein FtsI/penicillin-binding protein 2